MKKKECNPISQEGVWQNTCAQLVVASTPWSEWTHPLSALHDTQPLYPASARELSCRRTVEGSQMPHQFSVQLHFSSKKHFSVSLFPLFFLFLLPVLLLPLLSPSQRLTTPGLYFWSLQSQHKSKLYFDISASLNKLTLWPSDLIDIKVFSLRIWSWDMLSSAVGGSHLTIMPL